jgi:hypothetical protein
MMTIEISNGKPDADRIESGQSPGQPPGWSEDFARLTIASALFGDLLTKLPGAFTESLFGDANAPRQRIARAIEQCIKKSGSRGSRPIPEIVRDLLDDDLKTRTKPEQDATLDEWRDVQAVELPDDSTYVEEKVSAWIEYTRMAQALQDAATALRPGPEGLGTAREIMAKGAAVTAGSWTSYTADELDTLDISPQRFIVETIMPQRGVMWIGGAPKRGKSLFALYASLAITSGRETVAGRFKILARPKILYVAREDADFRVQDRQRDILSAWGAPPPGDQVRYVIQQKMDLLNPTDVTRLRELCVREGRTVLVLDTWTALAPGADPMSAETQAKLAAVVVQLSQEIGGLVIVVDHTRKNRPDGMPLTAAEILGPSQKWQAADHILMLDRKPQSSRYEFFVEGRDPGEERFILERSAPGSKVEKFQYAGTAEGMVIAAVEKGDTNRRRVLQVVVGAARPVTSTEVMVAVNALPGQEPLAFSTVRGHLTALFAGGWLDRKGKGPTTTYMPLPAAGVSADPTSWQIAGGSENRQ